MAESERPRYTAVSEAQDHTTTGAGVKWRAITTNGRKQPRLDIGSRPRCNAVDTRTQRASWLALGGNTRCALHQWSSWSLTRLDDMPPGHDACSRGAADRRRVVVQQVEALFGEAVDVGRRGLESTTSPKHARSAHTMATGATASDQQPSTTTQHQRRRRRRQRRRRRRRRRLVNLFMVRGLTWCGP
jgi:hypothetical protein